MLFSHVKNTEYRFYKIFEKSILVLLGLLFLSTSLIAQNFNRGASKGNFTRRSAFRQEIARLEITVEREGSKPLSIAQVPRVHKGDLLRIRMLEEPINGIMPDKSFWDWTLLVAFVNPLRNKKNEESVSREINFKRDGWYKEHLFKAPFDSQPVFFLYPKPKYRKKIKKLIRKNFSQIKKIGEKTLEIADAYAHINMFLNELQQVINTNQSGFRISNNYTFGINSQFNDNFFRNEMVERIAQSFNIRLPNCWRGSGGFGGRSNNFVSRAQCVAQKVRLEDFDVSVGKIIQQGGLFAASRLIEKFPELTYWINIAAAALDFILRATKKSPLKVVPTMASVNANNRQNRSNRNPRGRNRRTIPNIQKIRLFAQNPPTDVNFVTAFPVVLHKWQPDADPNVISLPAPKLMEPCLHMGQNILKNTDLTYDWLRDPFARDFRLIMSAKNGFSKEFFLTKNIGMSGWQLILTPRDLQTFPKVEMEITTKIVATRGFNQIESKNFGLAIAGSGTWEVPTEILSKFAVGKKRRIVVKNSNGSIRCLQSVIYKPSFGGEFTFAANSRTNPLRFSEDGKEAWFEIDATHFKPGQGSIEIRGYGSTRPQIIRIKLHPRVPEITKLKAHKGDSRILVAGERINQIRMLIVNGKTARPDSSPSRLSGKQTNESKAFVFQNRTDKILTKEVSVEMQLDAGRKYKYPKKFSILPARPTIQTGKNKEIEAIILGSSNKKIGQFDLSKYPVAGVDTPKMTIAVKTALTDYAFKTENISIKTRIENGQVGQNILPVVNIEVLDPSNLRIGFTFREQTKQYLAGRRLQFRILDRARGNSDWYTIKQTFVRVPQIDSVTCIKEQCEIVGKGLDYIGQISIDGGKVWNPPLRAQPTTDGKAILKISGVKDKKLLRIKLRDFPKTDGLEIGR